MTDEEKYLERLLGKDPGFKVPDGYFDDFASQLMNKLPEREPRVIKMKPTVWRQLRPAMLVAASTLVAVFTLGTYLHKSSVSKKEVAPQEQVAQKPSSYSSFDEIMDYAMVDNEDIYAYVSGN